jgi:hypothetical protein
MIMETLTNDTFLKEQTGKKDAALAPKAASPFSARRPFPNGHLALRQAPSVRKLLRQALN